MNYRKLYLLTLMPFVLGCIKNNNANETGKLDFDKFGRPYYTDNIVSERAFYKTTMGKAFTVIDEQITLVTIDGKSAVDASQLCYIPEFILDSKVMALTEFYKIGEDTETPQGGTQRHNVFSPSRWLIDKCIK